MHYYALCAISRFCPSTLNKMSKSTICGISIYISIASKLNASIPAKKYSPTPLVGGCHKKSCLFFIFTRKQLEMFYFTVLNNSYVMNILEPMQLIDSSFAANICRKQRCAEI